MLVLLCVPHFLRVLILLPLRNGDFCSQLLLPIFSIVRQMLELATIIHLKLASQIYFRRVPHDFRGPVNHRGWELLSRGANPMQKKTTSALIADRRQMEAQI